MTNKNVFYVCPNCSRINKMKKPNQYRCVYCETSIWENILIFKDLFLTLLIFPLYLVYKLFKKVMY